MIRYSLTILLGAFLLFQVQPVIAKRILPWFGGSPATWTTCMMFFQVALLGGYLYAHVITVRLSPRRQVILHVLVLAASLVALPIIPDPGWKPTGDEVPTWRILALLAATIGAPYLVLSTTGPLVQKWFSRTDPGRSPYRLYALSNFGSLLALVSYPVLVEPYLTQSIQAISWSVAYGLFVALCSWSALRVFVHASVAQESTTPNDSIATDTERHDSPSVDSKPTTTDLLVWLGLAAAPSILLLATTNQMCQEVAVVPFLWVLPLSLYLISFIFCFDHQRWYRRGPFAVLLGATAVLVLVSLLFDADQSLWFQILVYSSALFAACMTCHGELYRSRPSPSYLTLFYLTVASGGALGGLFVVLAAPLLFTKYWELHVGLSLSMVLALVAYYRDSQGGLYHGRPWKVWGVLIAFANFLVLALVLEAFIERDDVIERARDFYGVLTVLNGEDKNGQLTSMEHGRIQHGFQYDDPDKRNWKTSYYGVDSGVGLAIRQHPASTAASAGGSSLRVGVVGLGIGTLAAYGGSKDIFRFYEINPEVVRLAYEQFGYCTEGQAEVQIVLGDARLKLEQEIAGEQLQAFDVLAVDAFSGDAVPMHLLTRECFEIYWQHLKPDGILAVHVSNRYLDLKPVVRTLATASGRTATLFSSYPEYADPSINASDWVLVTNNREFLESEEIEAHSTPWPDRMPEIEWTDDYGGLFQVLYR